jgi:hypothetical protein
MKVFNSQKCPDPDFATIESDQILTTSVDGHPSRSDFSVLIDFNGNVLTKAED